MTRILVVDDEAFFRKVMARVLGGHKYDIMSAGGGEEALQILKTNTFDLMISDVNMTPMNGIELLQKSREAYPKMGVIMITGHDEIDVAVAVMQKGAFDFLNKPVQLDALFSTVQRSLMYYNASPDSNLLESKVGLLQGLVTKSAAMQKTSEMIRRVAPTNVAVLLCGEEGSDCELIARTLHYYSLRKDEPFLTLDCAAQSMDLIAEKLFGGSTDRPGLLELAQGGTLFIDTMDAMPLDIQSELLNVMQFKKSDWISRMKNMEIDVRMVAASSKPIDQLVEQGAFSENLYYRLSALVIDVPSLRSRSEDIPFLIDRAVRENLDPDADIPAMDSDVKHVLYSYTWPGNHAELNQTIRQLLSRSKNGAITKEMLPAEIVAVAPASKYAAEHERLKGQCFSAFWKDKQKKRLDGDGVSPKDA